MFFTTGLRVYDHVVGVNFAQVMQASDDIRLSSSALDTEMSNLNTYLEGTIFDPAAWEGTAQLQYRDTQTRWNTAAGNIATHLGTLSRTVSAVAEHMGDVERRARDTMAL